MRRKVKLVELGKSDMQLEHEKPQRFDRAV
jgi:hypothetical protein